MTTSDALLRNHNNKSSNLFRSTLKPPTSFHVLDLGFIQSRAVLPLECARHICAVSSLFPQLPGTSPATQAGAIAIAEKPASSCLPSVPVFRQHTVVAEALLVLPHSSRDPTPPTQTRCFGPIFADCSSASSINFFPVCCCLVKQLPSNGRSFRQRSSSSRFLEDAEPHRDSASLVNNSKDLGSCRQSKSLSILSPQAHQCPKSAERCFLPLRTDPTGEALASTSRRVGGGSNAPQRY